MSTLALAWDRLEPLAGVPVPRWNLIEARSCPVCGAVNGPELLRPDGLPLARCDACALWYLSEVPPERDLARFYATYWTAHRPAAFTARAARELVAQLARPQRSVGGYDRIIPTLSAALGGLVGKRVLEVGCGYGRYLVAARMAGAEVVGHDLSSEAVRFLRDHLGISAFDGELEQALARIGTVDAVMLIDLVEHPRDPLALIRTARTALRPGGLLGIWTPNGAAGPTCFRVDLEHLQYFSRETVAVVARDGWRIEHLETLGHPDCATSRVSRLLSRLRPVNVDAGEYHLFAVLSKNS